MNNDYDKSIWRLNNRMSKYKGPEDYNKASKQWKELQLLQKQRIEDDESICKNQQRNVPQR